MRCEGEKVLQVKRGLLQSKKEDGPVKCACHHKVVIRAELQQPFGKVAVVYQASCFIYYMKSKYNPENVNITCCILSMVATDIVVASQPCWLEESIVHKEIT